MLCHGDLVSNVKISDIMERHKARPKQDKHAIMSKVMISTVGSGDVTRCKGQEVVMATDKVTGQLLFQQISDRKLLQHMRSSALGMFSMSFNTSKSHWDG